MTANESLRDSMISHAVYFERYKTHEVNQLFRVLDEANRAAKAVVLKTDGAATKARYQAIMKEIASISAQARDSIDKQLRLDLVDLIGSESEFLQGTINKAVGVDLEMILPVPKQVFTAATFMPFCESATFESMLNDIDKNLYSQWDMSVRVGYMTGETAQSINRRVLGSVSGLQTGTMAKLKRGLESNTRTMLAHYAEQTRNSIYRENEDLFQGYQRLETLDTSTCLVCGAEDKKIYKRIEDSPGIIHLCCRGIDVPLLKNWQGLGITERASVDGVVPGNTDYETWLRAQSPERQKDVLGPSRYELFKNGASLKGFTSDGRKITLKEWKEFEGNVLPTSRKSANRVTFQSEKDITAAGREILKQARADNSDVFDILRAKRDFGSEKAHDFKKGSSSFAKDAILDAQKYYPKDWLDKSLAVSKETPLLAKKLTRGYYSNGIEPAIAISRRKDCAVHELAHRMECLFPEIVKAEREFYNRRTEGESLKSLRYLTKNPYPLSEVARADKFRDPYMGKYYKGERNYEVLSMGIEKIVNKSYIKGDDDDFDSFIIGLLLGV